MTARAPAHPSDADCFPWDTQFRRFGSMDSLDTSTLDSLALGGEMNDGSLDFMIGETFPGKVDAAEKPQPALTDERPAQGAAEADDARLMELIDGLDPPDLSACTAMNSGGAPQQMQHQQSGALSVSAAACSPPPDAEPAPSAAGKDFTRASRTNPFFREQQELEQQQAQQREQQQQQREQQQEQHDRQQQQAQQDEMMALNPAGSVLFSMASCDGAATQAAAQYDSMLRATSAAHPLSYSPSRLSIGAAPGGFMRHSATEIHHSAPAGSGGALVRQTNSAHNLAHRAASLPTAVLRSTGKLQHHHQSLRSPFENASEGSDGFGDDDAAAAGATGSVPDLSTMRLDSFHEARRATLAYITGDGGPLPSDTSTSGDSGTLFKSASVTLDRAERRNSIGNGVYKDVDSMRRRSVRRASHIAQVALTERAQRTKDLAGQLEAAMAANAALKSRTQLLETFMGLQEPAQDAEQTEAWWLDGVTQQMVEQQLNLGRALTFTLRAGHPIVLTREQVASLPWTDFCKLWKDYMVVMAECLVEAAGSVASPPGQRLAHLVYETGILRGCLQLDAPAQHNRLLCFLPDGEMRPPPPSAARWATICTSLLLTQSQKTQLVQLRRMYLRALGKSLGRRRLALQHISGAMSVCDSDDAGPDRFESTIEAVERLRRALRDEHSLLTQYKMIAWGRVFTPIQAALATVQSYPWTCDVPSIINVVAASFGEPSATELLLQAQQ